MKVSWFAAAVEDLQAIREFIARDDPGAAQAIGLKILDAVGILAEFPAVGRAGRVTGTREMIIAGTPYIVPYRVRGERIEILRVMHGARDWPVRF